MCTSRLHNRLHCFIYKIKLSFEVGFDFSVTQTHARTRERARTHTHRRRNGHFFRSCRQLYLSSFSDTHTHTQGNGHFSPSCRQLYLLSFSDTPFPSQRRSLQMPGGTCGPADRSWSVSLLVLKRIYRIFGCSFSIKFVRIVRLI